MKARSSVLQPGDYVLVRHVGLHGKHKLAGRWEHKPYIVREQPNPDIHVYTVQEEGSRKKPRTLHRNLLLPFMGLPCLDRSESISDQPSGQDIQQDGSTVGVVDIRPEALLLPSSGDSELDADTDAHNKSGYEDSSDAEVFHLANMYHT